MTEKGGLGDCLVPQGAAGGAIPIRVRSSRSPGLNPRAPSAVGDVDAAPAPPGFRGRAGDLAVLPNASGGISEVLFAADTADAASALRALPSQLPAGTYRLVADEGVPPDFLEAAAAALAWALGAYRFDRYKSSGPLARPPRLAIGLGEALAEIRAVAEACAWTRDLINTPANDLGPAEMEGEARAAAARWGAEVSVVAGEALLEGGYPLVHAVGRAAARSRAPRVIELTWGRPGDPVLVLVGKGVAFDSGGLDLKPAAGMRLMKKDMGGAAHVLALGQLVARARLPVRLVVLVPAVENAVSGEAFRPGDVLRSRAGLTVEIGNTDAEGRLILADALARAGELAPALTIDMATLTGAARVALGPQVVPFYTDDDGLAADLAAAGAAVSDPLWRMPLWTGYASALDSDIADIRNDSDPWAQAGSITAALFLRRFAPTSGLWAHFDIFGWNPRGRPGFPVGGEAQAIRALFAVIKSRFG